MATRVREELTYDAPAEAVHAMLNDAAFRERVCARMRVIRGTATVEPRGSASVVTIDQVQPATGLPSFATKLVGDEIRIVQQETWTSRDHADVHVTIPGKPGEMVGSADLVESGGRTVETVDLEIRVRVPLVGGRIEALVADMLRKALAAENAEGRAYLSVS
jgi:hypothetical protein